MLGHIAVDRITGLKGIITAVADFLHSPQRIELSPEKLHEGAPVKGVWLDVPRLRIGKSKIKAPKFESTVTMGDKVTDNLPGSRVSRSGASRSSMAVSASRSPARR